MHYCSYHAQVLLVEVEVEVDFHVVVGEGRVAGRGVGAQAAQHARVAPLLPVAPKGPSISCRFTSIQLTS